MSTDFATHVASNPVSRAILSRWDLLDLPGSCVTAVVSYSTKVRGGA